MNKLILCAFLGTFIAFGAFASGTSEKSATQTTLRFVNCEGNDNEVLKAVLADFEKKHPDIVINSQYMVNSQLKKQMEIAKLSNTLPDLTVFDNPDFASFAAAGYLVDLTDRMNAWGQLNEFQPGPLSTVQYKGRTYGIPWYSNDLALFYNKDMLDKAGVQPPKTWNDLQSAAKKLTRNGVYGLAIAAVKSEVGTFQFIPWLYSAGGSYDKLDSPAAVHALSFLAQLIRDGSMSKEVVNWAHGDLSKVFEGGQAAMVIEGSWEVWVLRRDTPNLNWGVAPIPTAQPGGKSVTDLGGYDVGITTNAKNVDAAFTFLTYIGGKDAEGKYAMGVTSIPSRKDVQLSQEYSQYPINVFVNLMPDAVARVNVHWPEVSANIQLAMQEALLGVKTPAAALKDAQAKNAQYWN
jgi:multiple sugar transport system substrate-binding protein